MVGRISRTMMLVVSCAIVLSLLLSVHAGAAGTRAGPGYAYGLNGNQEIVGDPSRPVVYYADRDSGSLVIWNYSSDVTTNLSIGGQPICVDLGADGDQLYVASAGVESITVVDVGRLVVERSIPLGFIPSSLAVRSATELYVSSANDTLVRMVNLTSDEVSVSFDAGYTAILDARVGGDDLLASAIWKPDGHVNITRYSLTPAPHAVVSKDLGLGVTAQVAVDWDNGTVYLAANGLGGFQKRSLSDLELLASYSDWRDTNGIALSRDTRTVYAVCTSSYWDLPGGQQIERWGSMIYILAADDLTLEGMKFISGERGAITASSDPNSVFVGSPLEKVGVGLNVLPGLPAPGSIYGYTPSYVEFSLAGDILPAFQPEAVVVRLDGDLLNVSLMPSSSYRALLSSALGGGSHTVTVDIAGCIHGEWNFTVDPSSPSAIIPALNLTSPAVGSYVSELPGSVAVSYQVSAPGPISSNISLFFNGIPMTEYTEEWQPGMVFGYVPYDLSMSYGVYTVNANMSWLGGSHNYSWSFTWQQNPILSPAYPYPGSILPSSPSSVSADLFLGRPAVVINSVEVAIDETTYPHFIGMLDENNAFTGANLSTPLGPGSHSVHVTVSTNQGDLQTDWEFTVDALVARQYKQDFSILIPTTWTYSEDVVVGGTKVDLSTVGPVLYGITTNLLVQSDINWSMAENQSALLGMPDSIVEGLQANGVRCGIMETPNIVELSEHMAVQYSIQWYDLSVIQRQVILVNQESHRYWIMTFTVKDGQYFWLGSLFDAMEHGFTLLPGANQTKLTSYDYWGEFTIPVPDTWTTKENLTLGGQFVKLMAVGPVLDGLRVNFAVGSEKNESVNGDRAYLRSQVNATIHALAENGVGVTLRGEENFTSISGLPAMIFALDFVELPITEKMILLADENSHTYWAVTCACSRSSYTLLEPTFDAIMTGITIVPTVEQRLPGSPTGLHLVAGDGRITLNWTAPSDCGTSNITGYEVYRGTASGSLALVTTLGKNSTSFIDSNLQNAQVYYYKVRAVSSVGQGNLTDVAAATPFAPAPEGRVDTTLIVGVVAIVAIGGVGAGVALWRKKK